MLLVDTIVLNFDGQISREQLALWDFDESRKPNGHFNHFYSLIETLDNGAEIKCRYYPFSFQKFPLLTVEFSIPKVLYGNNFTTVNDQREAISSLNQIFISHNLPIRRIEDGVISRIDIYYDHQVGEFVPYYIKAFQPLEFSYRTTILYNTQEVLYKNGSISSKFYGKEKECGDPKAHGILREEVTLRANKVKEYTGKKHPTINDITEELQIKVLEENQKALHIFGVSIGTADMTYKMLCQAYGELAGTFYYGALHANVNLPKEIILSAGQSHPRSIERRLQKIVDLGIPPTLTECKVPLPPLTINICKI